MRALWGIGMGGAILLAATLTSGWGQDVNRTTGSAATTNDWFDPAAWTLGHAPLAAYASSYWRNNQIRFRPQGMNLIEEMDAASFVIGAITGDRVHKRMRPECGDHQTGQ